MHLKINRKFLVFRTSKTTNKGTQTRRLTGKQDDRMTGTHKTNILVGTTLTNKKLEN
jgi:hypothetical protein